jgi:hypothetical protein
MMILRSMCSLTVNTAAGIGGISAIWCHAISVIVVFYILKSNHHSRTGSSAPHNNHPHHYNPRADETDYDDYETPEIGDIHGDEVYNNID